MCVCVFVCLSTWRPLITKKGRQSSAAIVFTRRFLCTCYSNSKVAILQHFHECVENMPHIFRVFFLNWINVHVDFCWLMILERICSLVYRTFNKSIDAIEKKPIFMRTIKMLIDINLICLNFSWLHRFSIHVLCSMFYVFIFEQNKKRRMLFFLYEFVRREKLYNNSCIIASMNVKWLKIDNCIEHEIKLVFWILHGKFLQNNKKKLN